MKPITDTQVAALHDQLLRKKAMFREAFAGSETTPPTHIKVDVGSLDLEVVLGIVSELQTRRRSDTPVVLTPREGSQIIDAVILASQVIHAAIIGEENDDAEVDLGRGRKVYAGYVDRDLFEVVQLVKRKMGAA